MNFTDELTTAHDYAHSISKLLPSDAFRFIRASCVCLQVLDVGRIYARRTIGWTGAML